MQVIRQRYWVNPPPEPETDWRAVNSYCITDSGNFTGYKGWQTLEEFYVDSGLATGNTKPNTENEPEYVEPILDEDTCPIPRDTYWFATDSYCIQENGENTGFRAYNTLREIYSDTFEPTGVEKPNIASDPNYVAPFYNEYSCPLPEPEPVLDWRPIDRYCLEDSNGNFTGDYGWLYLEEYDINTGDITGEIKFNNSSEPEYVAPEYNTKACPLPLPPEPNLAWRPINEYCVKEDGENTGYTGYYNLEEYNEDTLEATGNIKPNVNFDPDYIPPVYDINNCPLPIQPNYIWEGYQPYCITEDVENLPQIDSDTKINILFDGSGSMNKTLPKLKDMINGPLKTTLVEYYGSEQNYLNQVTVIDMGADTGPESTGERFLYWMNERINTEGNTITFVFQNEAFPHYEPVVANPESPRKEKYDLDIQNLNNTLTNYNFDFKAVIFQVNNYLSDGSEYVDFKKWLQYIENSVGPYSGEYGFSNRSNFVFRYDVLEAEKDGATASYYKNIVVQELNKLGYEI